jgi:hypothetical protein
MTAVGLIRGLVVTFFLSKMVASASVASNHLKLFLFYLPLSLHTGQKIGTSDPYTGKKKNGTLNLSHGTLTGTNAPDPGHRTRTGCPDSNRGRNSLFRQLFITGQSVPVL